MFYNRNSNNMNFLIFSLVPLNVVQCMMCFVLISEMNGVIQNSVILYGVILEPQRHMGVFYMDI